MPGIVGIFKKEENNLDIEKLFKKMCNIMKHEEWYKIDTFLQHSTGLGRINLGILNSELQPIYNEDKNVLIIMDGEIFDYQNFKNFRLFRESHSLLLRSGQSGHDKGPSYQANSDRRMRGFNVFIHQPRGRGSNRPNKI